MSRAHPHRDRPGLLAGSHAWQEQAFAQLTEDWDPEDAARFADYLQRLESELP